MKFVVPKTTRMLRAIDFVMIPIMFILGGFKLDSIQETHPWHSYRDFTEDDVDIQKTILTDGTDVNAHLTRHGFVFHAPLFGGWKNYSVYAPLSTSEPFRIGWITYENGGLREVGIHKLLIKNGAIRMLDGPPTYKVKFFAVDQSGNQIDIQKIGIGRLGDHKFKHLRLF